METYRTALGNRGEQKAVEHLKSSGYEIIERNYRCSRGEIDIIARESGDLVFIEVKTRRTENFGKPSEAVDARKQKKIIGSAMNYLASKDLGEIECRFDVAEVYYRDGQPAKVELIRNAFSADGFW